MGTFAAHMVAATAFLTLSTWSMIRTLQTYFKCSLTGKRFRSSLTYPVACCSSQRTKTDLEAIAVMCAVVVEITGEVIITTVANGKPYPGPGEYMHGNMYLLFGLSYLLVMIKKPIQHVFPSTEELTYCALASAYFFEGILFKAHLGDSDGVDVRIHIMLANTTFACAGATLLEMVLRNHPLAALGRSFFTFIQGTWLMQAAFAFDVSTIATNPVPNPPVDHERIKLIPSLYIWHFIFAVFILISLSTCVSKGVRRKEGPLLLEQANSLVEENNDSDDNM